MENDRINVGFSDDPRYRLDGKDLKEAYCKVMGIPNSNEPTLPIPGNPALRFHVRSSHTTVRKSLLKSIELAKQRANFSFIPLVVGEPGDKEEMILALRRDGVWVGEDIPNRNKVRAEVLLVIGLLKNRISLDPSKNSGRRIKIP